MIDIKINKNSKTRIYVQLYNAFCQAIKEGHLQRGDKLPSVNQLSAQYSISRDTVFAAYKEIEKKGIAESKDRKGYYVKSTNLRAKRNIFLLFDELNGFKEEVYYSFIEELGTRVKVDIYFHNFNIRVFKLLIEENLEKYTDYVIMPSGMPSAKKIIEQLPAKKTYILDQIDGLSKNINGVYQDFYQVVYKGLTELKPKLNKYNRACLVYKHRIGYPESISEAFKDFFTKMETPCSMHDNWEEIMISKGGIYFVVDDKDLAEIIFLIRQKGLEIGKDVGIISYNEMHLNKVVDVGITTISTDFALMGKRIAQMVLANEKGLHSNGGIVYHRRSL